MKFFDKAASRDTGERFPRIIQIRESVPLNKILETILDPTGVPDILDFEVLVIVFDI